MAFICKHGLFVNSCFINILFKTLMLHSPVTPCTLLTCITTICIPIHLVEYPFISVSLVSTLTNFQKFVECHTRKKTTLTYLCANSMAACSATALFLLLNKTTVLYTHSPFVNPFFRARDCLYSLQYYLSEFLHTHCYSTVR